MDRGDSGFSRREVVYGIATAVAAGVAASPASAAEPKAGGAGGGGGASPAGLPNPVTAHPRPPFPRQTQDWPGLQSKMTPRPDCGERSYHGTGRLVGRKALVTGGDSGIGRAAAIAFAREGADVAINYLPAEESDAREVVALIKESGRKAVAVQGDLRDEGFCRQLVVAATRELGGLDILVNNAGKQHAVERIEDLTTEQFDATYRTNVYAMFWLCKAALAHMPPGGAIINTASVEAYAPEPHLLDYASTKAAIVTFTKALAKQVAKRGVRVNAVAPGPYWTPLQVTGGQFPDKLVNFGQNTPLGRPGQPVEIAPVYVLLASGEATDITGQVFGASGGRGEP
ncbi:MAG TPA: SDR family oxidoreductase [Polyangia bacterium]|nr:SDR family oxidoreductase [Polyangia bacterium]